MTGNPQNQMNLPQFRVWVTVADHTRIILQQADAIAQEDTLPTPAIDGFWMCSKP